MRGNARGAVHTDRPLLLVNQTKKQNNSVLQNNSRLAVEDHALFQK
jgi:hypothetical protein